MDEFSWQVLGRDGMPIADLPAPSFPSQADAEAWLGESWQELADAGAAAVSLRQFEDVVYGPMSLDPPS